MARILSVLQQSRSPVENLDKFRSEKVHLLKLSPEAIFYQKIEGESFFTHFKSKNWVLG